jgi:hypothetical protein
MFHSIKNKDEEYLKNKYLKLSKIFLIIVIFYTVWIAFIISSVYFLGMGNKWAYLTMDQWVISSIVLFSFFIILEILLFLNYLLVKRKRIEAEKPKPAEFKGRKLHSFTIPIDSKGGIYSKTFIQIDENNILNLRYQMISPSDLSGKVKI